MYLQENSPKKQSHRLIHILEKMGQPGPGFSKLADEHLGKVWKDFASKRLPETQGSTFAEKVEDLLPLALDLAGRYECQEAIKPALRKLIRAVEKFDPDRNVPIEEFVRTCIQGGLEDWHRSFKKRQSKVFSELEERDYRPASPHGPRASKRAKPGDLEDLDWGSELIHQIRAALSQNQFEAFERFHRRKESIARISQLMMVAEGTVKSWRYRTKSRIRKLGISTALLESQPDHTTTAVRRVSESKDE